jgi:cytochrome P450
MNSRAIMCPDLAALLRQDPRVALDKLVITAPGIYAFSESPLAAVVTAPDVIVKIMRDPDGVFEKGARVRQFRFALGDGSAASDFPDDGSDYYRPLSSLEALRVQKRRFLQPAMSGRHVARWHRIIVQRIVSEFPSWEGEVARDVYVDLTRLMAKVAAGCLFGCDFSSDAIAAIDCVRRTTAIIDRSVRSAREHSGASNRTDLPAGPEISLPCEPDLSERRGAIESLFAGIESGARDCQAEDSLGLVLQRARFTPGGEPLTDAARRGALISSLFASYENSASAAAWALWSLACQPSIQKRAAEEVRQVDLETLRPDQLPYLTACIKETMRLYPPVWSVGRSTRCDVTLLDHKFPAGSTVFASPWVQHRHHSAWSDADRFEPRRFLHRKPRPGYYFPFGLGTRFCLGEVLAEIELALTLAAVLQRWHLAPAKGYPVPEPWLATTQRPSPGVFLHLRRRRER